MLKAKIFTLAALLVVLMLNLCPSWAQGISKPEDLVWVTPDSASGPALFYNDDSIFICTAMGANKVELRNSKDGILIRKSEELDYSIDKLFLSPDNKFIAVLLDQDSEIKTAFYVLDANTLEIKYQYIKGQSSQTWDLVFSSNSQKLFRLGSYNMKNTVLEIYDTGTFEKIQDTLLYKNCMYLDMHPNNDFLAIGLLNGSVEFRDPITLSLKRTYSFKDDGQIYWMLLSPDGKFLEISFDPIKGNRQGYILDTQDFSLKNYTWAENEIEIGFSFSKDCNYLLYHFRENTDSSLRIRRVVDKQNIFFYNHKIFNSPYRLISYDVSYDNQYFLSSVNNHIAKIKFLPNLSEVSHPNTKTIDTIKPNPGTNIIEITLSTEIIVNKIEIANESGQYIQSGYKILENIPGKILLDISGLSNGMYIINLISSNSVLSKKLMVMR